MLEKKNGNLEKCYQVDQITHINNLLERSCEIQT